MTRTIDYWILVEFLDDSYKEHFRFAVLFDMTSSARFLALVLKGLDDAPSSDGATRTDRRLAARIRLILLDYDDGELNFEEIRRLLWTARTGSLLSSGEIDPSADTVTFSGDAPVRIELVSRAFGGLQKPSKPLKRHRLAVNH